MTPKKFFAADGKPFPHTWLDRRAGVEAPNGMHLLADDGAVVDLLDEVVFNQVRELALRGETEGKLFESSQFFRRPFKYVETLLRPPPGYDRLP
jgi:hypothetical protein